MRYWRVLLLVAVLLAVLRCAAAETVHVPMRDGAKLATDVYVPAEGGPRFPAILTRSVYGRGAGPQLAKAINARGYVFVIQDTRGRGDSEGDRDPVFADDGWGERQDGVDTVNWIRSQPWSNGKVGTWGGSALGITQVLLAGAGAPVQAQTIIVAASDFYSQMIYPGGVFRKHLLETWLRGQKSLHVLELWHSHPAYDDYWRLFDAEARAEHVTAPGIHVGGWFDIFAQGTLNNFTSRQYRGGEGARGNQVLIMGPWPHGVTRKVGELEFPENFSYDINAAGVQFFDHWLKGEENGIMDEPVHYYTMGACGEAEAPGNEWRTAKEWPPFPLVEKVYYLTPDGGLETAAPEGDPVERSYSYDPTDPVPTHGGPNLFPDVGIGPMDQRKVSGRPDVLCFQTEPLEAPLEVTGAVKARLYVSTDAPDTDFTAKLVDVYPDGRELLILDGIRRLKFREGFEKAEPLPAGEVGEIEIDLGPTSLIFNKGHRIGVQVSSSNYPRFERNPNTGEDLPRYTGDLAEGDRTLDPASVRVAHNTVHMGADRPSALILSVSAP